MGMAPSAEQRSTQSPEPTATVEPPAEKNTVKGTTKEDPELLQSVIEMIEEDLAQETQPVRQENIRAVLAFVREHGYPACDRWKPHDPRYSIWAMNGIARCQTAAEFRSQPWGLPPPGFNKRGQIDGYGVVSSRSERCALRHEPF